MKFAKFEPSSMLLFAKKEMSAFSKVSPLSASKFQNLFIVLYGSMPDVAIFGWSLSIVFAKIEPAVNAFNWISVWALKISSPTSKFKLFKPT